MVTGGGAQQDVLVGVVNGVEGLGLHRVEVAVPKWWPTTSDGQESGGKLVVNLRVFFRAQPIHFFGLGIVQGGHGHLRTRTRR